jgi:GUN4-like
MSNKISISTGRFLCAVLFFFAHLGGCRHRSSADRYVSYSNFEKIDKSLEQKKIKQADTETAALVFKILGKEKVRQIGRLDASNFSCIYLLKLDQIWKDKSNGEYGFTAQSEVLSKANLGKNSNPSESDLRAMLGWNKDNEKNNSYPKGYFPQEMYQYNFVVPAFSQRIAECQKEK